MRRVPRALRLWFVLHFVVDMAFALPLMVAPEWFLTAMGWTAVDPVAARLVAAALFAIGLESWLVRDAPIETFTVMLRLKSLWSGAAVLGLALSAAQGAPPMTWLLLGVFVSFAAVWNFYRIRLKRAPP